MNEIINTVDQVRAYGGDRVVIFYSPRDRANPVCGWVVSHYFNGRLVAIPGPWYDHGSKSFSVAGRSDKGPVLAEAIKWANKEYGKREFVRNRSGCYVEKEVNEKFPIRKK